ncbi:unnamed protein product [Linum trigynum]|uniref:Uncharacterized protein n=1 Tax=Linum trigynum TaxID=586398 RepID=A0AAV2CA25_9ROSI
MVRALSLSIFVLSSSRAASLHLTLSKIASGETPISGHKQIPINLDDLPGLESSGLNRDRWFRVILRNDKGEVAMTHRNEAASGGKAVYRRW